jgi:hypothetical protein
MRGADIVRVPLRAGEPVLGDDLGVSVGYCTVAGTAPDGVIVVHVHWLLARC